MKSASDLGQFMLYGNFMFFDKCDNILSDVEVENRRDTKYTTC